eukprot:5175137-Prymnesium_polylepis.1
MTRTRARRGHVRRTAVSSTVGEMARASSSCRTAVSSSSTQPPRLLTAVSKILGKLGVLVGVHLYREERVSLSPRPRVVPPPSIDYSH